MDVCVNSVNLNFQLTLSSEIYSKTGSLVAEKTENQNLVGDVAETKTEASEV